MAEQAASVESRINEMLFAEDVEAGLEPEPEERQEADPQVREEREPEPVEAEAEQEEVEATAEDSEQDEPAGDERVISSLHELADELGVDVADMYNLRIPINTPDGRKEISLGEWKDSVQATETAKAHQAQIAEMAKQRETELKQFSQTITQSAEQVKAVLNMAEGELVRDYQSVNWQELRQYDPAEFAAKQQEFNARKQQIDHAKLQAMNSLQAAQQQQAEMMRSALPEQSSRLMDLIPEWKNSDVAEAEKPKVAQYLVSLGYAPQEVDNLYDARAAAMAYKAMKYDALKSSKPAAKKLVRIGSKPMKPGKSQSKAEQRSAVNEQKRAILKKTGSVDALAAILNSDEYLGDM